MFQGQIEEIPFLSQLREIGFFPHFSPIFHLPLQKTEHSHPVKNYFSNTYRTGLCCQKVLS